MRGRERVDGIGITMGLGLHFPLAGPSRLGRVKGRCPLMASVKSPAFAVRTESDS